MIKMQNADMGATAKEVYFDHDGSATKKIVAFFRSSLRETFFAFCQVSSIPPLRSTGSNLSPATSTTISRLIKHLFGNPFASPTPRRNSSNRSIWTQSRCDSSWTGNSSRK